ncbi:MFS transporter [Streptomyces sp. NBC_00536]|uniref:MFS transporter n=1 Tax=Streptomyces sp. NBC_00536 TaxID=2975769 RepID=UPI002E81F7CE|nr:MFS transporter [Streptomyces sp. NBC_00536]WUC82541.1 MFS transporter [Streptomyces sp. NBC_00536]
MSAPAPSAPVPLGKNRNFRLLWSANALSTLGSQAGFIAVPLLVLSLTGSVTAFGLVMFIESAVAVTAGIPAGILVDRLDRRKVMLACDVLRAAVSAVFVIALTTGHASMPLIIGVSAVTGILSSPFGPAAGAVLRTVVPPEQLVSAYSVNQARNSAITLAGPLIGAALYGVWPVLPFLVDGVSFLASAACVLFLRAPRSPRPEAPARRPRLRSDLVTGLRFIRTSPFLRYSVVNAAMMGFALSAVVITLISLHARGGAAPMSTGVLISVSGAGNLLGAVLAPRLNRLFSPRRLVLGVCWSTALLVPAMTLSDALWWTLALIGVSSIATPAANIALSAAVTHTVPDHLQGRVQTTCALLPALIGPLGPLAAGLLTDRASASLSLLVFGFLLVALAFFSTFGRGLHHIPDLRRRPEARPESPVPVARTPKPVRS